MSTPQGGSAASARPAPTTTPAATTSTAAAASGSAQTPSQTQPGTGQPAGRALTARQQRRRDETSSTPRLLRLARAGAAAAALLTGVVATGTFSTDGINATPNVVADQWAAAEQARVDIPRADLLAAQRVTDPDGVDQQTLEAYDEVLRAAATDLSRMGDDAGVAAGDWSAFVTGVERAAAQESTDVYADASRLAGIATEQVAAVADARADALLTGSRSVLTTVVGTLGVVVLVGIMVWLALRTRRIVNLPLAGATLITAGLTWLSVNPGALPLDYDQYVEDTRASTTALQEVYQARTAQVAAAGGVDVDAPEQQVTEATQALERLDDPELEQAWSEVSSGEDPAASADAYAQVESALADRVSDDLASVDPGVGAPAALTAAGALLLGVVAAGLAWTGITQRLRDYR
ncbi:hypothetical protein AVL62_02085 [Serinicoccus chungangensis]|uniref:Uncharacterized protein n=1 Tax=Serinicoccus chungangensis TaxID=767452 RepID=A0A0W8I5Q5_9MICO|nr:hypothetical protein [Serinicoccus chungangensis]KUG53594.1 hypothetical protein AVL62_02085 [Serinicoccus chungangensis]